MSKALRRVVLRQWLLAAFTSRKGGLRRARSASASSNEASDHRRPGAVEFRACRGLPCWIDNAAVEHDPRLVLCQEEQRHTDIVPVRRWKPTCPSTPLLGRTWGSGGGS